ncbi:MAG: phenylalanine--tRNA ligase subunit alpha, partial [Muribaculaceae bacterium]|nr:phenylalanine--tRNA ligase subunit alpha [Muribaculaceae bacterium]
MINKINNLKAEIEGLKASNAAEVEALRIKYLSKKGEVSLLFNDFRNVPAEQKKEMGQLLNELKNLATDKINALREALESADTSCDGIDLTRTPSPIKLGTRHP